MRAVPRRNGFVPVLELRTGTRTSVNTSVTSRRGSPIQHLFCGLYFPTPPTLRGKLASMPVETCSYTLSLGHKSVGSQLVRTAVSGRVTTVEARTQFQGVFGQQSLTQTSQLHTRTAESLRYFEEIDSKEGKRSFEVTFDVQNGLVTATRRLGSQTDYAETPYLLPYSDPLGLLHRLRSAVQDGTPVSLRVPLLGKDVMITPLDVTEIETALGVRRAVGFVLYPGPGYVYIDAEPPYALVRLVQPTEHGLVEAFLTQRAQEDGTLSTKAGAEARPSKRRRRGGRRRRRVE